MFTVEAWDVNCPQHMASERFVLHMARTDAEVMAKARQANFQALPGGTASLRANIGGDQIQRESTSLDPDRAKALRIKPRIHGRFEARPDHARRLAKAFRAL